MLAEITGIVVPLPSQVRRLTSSLEATDDRFGTRNASLYARSYGGGGLRNRTQPILPGLAGCHAAIPG